MKEKPWKDHIFAPKHVGVIAETEKFIVLRGWERDFSRGWAVCVYACLDEKKERFMEVKFQAFGPSFLIGLTDVLCEWMEGKTLIQLQSLPFSFFSDYLLAHHIEEKEKINDFLFLIIRRILVQCLSFTEEKPTSIEPMKDWKTASAEKKKEMVETVLDKEVRPYIAMDQGGVQVVQIDKDEVTILYEGACVGCAGAGSTLLSIERVLRQWIHPDIRVKAQASSSIDYF